MYNQSAYPPYGSTPVYASAPPMQAPYAYPHPQPPYGPTPVYASAPPVQAPYAYPHPQPPYGSSPGYASAPPMQAPYAHPTAQASEWTTGLYGCTDDCSNCCMTCWCPCVIFGRIAEIADEGRTTCGIHAAIYTVLAFHGVPCLYSCFFRTKLRARFNLPKEPCGDCCVHCCCESCALCQEHRELKNRGLNPAAGWVGQPMVPPPMPQAMYK